MTYDFCIVGGGILGLATAMDLLRRQPGSSVLLLEKERLLASHQTGHNSGVIHAGIYYKPGSLKAKLCREGAQATKAFCQAHQIPFETIGKLVVATNETEHARLINLEQNAQQNGIEIRRLSAPDLKAIEPNVSGVSALLVPSSGIVDYARVARAMGDLITAQGGHIELGVNVDRVEETVTGVTVVAGDRRWLAKMAVVCAGLQADRLAPRRKGQEDFQIVPFRGEYYSIRPEKRGIVRHMIYPVPDPELPFLGIHLTPMINGELTVGPNAVLGWSREGYAKFSVSPRDIASYARFPGFWKVIGSNLSSGLEEMRDSLFKKSYLEKCRKYCPGLELEDLTPFRAGIRAQAVTRSGQLVHDFLLQQSERVLHVCNAPSPAATSAIPIGRTIAERLLSATGTPQAHAHAWAS